VVVAVMMPPLAIVLVLAYATVRESALTAALCLAGVAVGVLVSLVPALGRWLGGKLSDG
jgi:hypothetical protein